MAEETNPEANATPPLTEEVMRAILAGPAPYANRMYVTLAMHGLRLTFTEQDHEGREYFRAATFLSLLDARNLIDLLERQLDIYAASLQPAEDKAK